MGAVRFLCITILLVALAVAQDCNGNGYLNANGACICNSGFSDAACATNFGMDAVSGCNVNAAPALNKKDDRFPVIDSTVDTITFTNNVLHVAIAGEIVPNRRYDSINFIQGGATAVAGQCNLNGTSSSASYWSQLPQTGACRDEFALNMPWGSWSDCGWTLSQAETNSGAYYVYRATFVLTYTDALGEPFNIPESTYHPELFRKSAVAYKLYVRFLKNIEIFSQQLVTVNDTLALNVAITTFEYDPSTQSVLLGISTIVRWPAKLLRETVTLSIQTGSATTSTFSFDGQGAQTGAPTNSASAMETSTYCPQSKYNNCLQYYEFVLYLAPGGCDFNAVYILSAVAATCRDTPDTCTNATTESFVQVTHSDVCGTVVADPIITGQLVSFDSNHNPQTQFELGYRGYFEVDMQSANDFNLTWIDIWVVDNLDQEAFSPNDPNSVMIPHTQWLYKNFQVQSDGFWNYDNTQFPAGHFAGASPVDLNVYDVTKNANPGQLIFTPKFDFLFDSRIFHIPLFNADGSSQVTKGFTLHASGKIVYANNEQYGRKRDEATEEIVNFVWKTDSASLDANTKFNLVKMETSSVKSSSNSNTNTALLASLVPVAGIALVVVAVAIIAAVIIVRRKKTSNAFATLN